MWHTIGLPLLGLMYVRAKDVPKIPAKHKWQFQTKLQLAVEQMLRFAEIAKKAGKAVWVVADGAYAKCPFLKPLRAAGVVVVSRLRKDAALVNLPPQLDTRGRVPPLQSGPTRHPPQPPPIRPPAPGAARRTSPISSRRRRPRSRRAAPCCRPPPAQWFPCIGRAAA